jgi:hypothetical protein
MQLIRRILCHFFGHRCTTMSLFQASIRDAVKCDRCGDSVDVMTVKWG